MIDDASLSDEDCFVATKGICEAKFKVSMMTASGSMREGSVKSKGGVSTESWRPSVETDFGDGDGVTRS